MLERRKVEHIFLSLGIIFGLILVFLIPPLQAPDEDSHFKKSYIVSTLNLFPQIGPQGNIGNYVPRSILEFENSMRNMMGNMDAKYSYKSMYVSSHLEVAQGEEEFVEFSTSKTNPILFVPQAIGMFLLKVTFDNPVLHWSDNISPVNYVYVGRVANLIFYLVMCYYAIKHIPFLKNTLLLIALMPMTLSLASSLSYDALINGSLFLFLAVVLKVCFSDEVKVIDRKTMLFFIVFSAIMIHFKQVYVPLLLLILFIPKEKFSNKKQKVYFSLSVLGAAILSYAIWSGLSGFLLRNATVASDSNAVDQIKFIINHPFQYASILWDTMMASGRFYFIGFIGNLGWLDTNYPFLYLIMYAVIIFFSAVFDQTSVQVGYRFKVSSVLIGILVIILVETALYIIWTSIEGLGGVGAPLITGVQSRYFIPIAIPVLLVLKNNFCSYNRYGEKAATLYNWAVPRFVVFSMILTTFILMLRYWITPA